MYRILLKYVQKHANIIMKSNYLKGKNAMNNKLQINTVAGMLDIIGSVLYLIAPFKLVGNAIGG